MSQVFWLKYPSSGTWHAWEKGAAASGCGLLTTAHLRTEPASRIQSDPPDPTEADREPVCKNCLAQHGPVADSPEKAADEWVGVIKRRAKRAGVKLKIEDVEDLADLLSRLGPPGTTEANEVFEEIASVLLKKVSKRHRRGNRQVTVTSFPKFREAVSVIPPGKENLVHIANSIRLWRHITGRDPSEDRYNSDRVIETILAVPEPEPYIKHLAESGLPNLAAVFHPNTLERAKKNPRLRGLFWKDSSGSGIDPLEGVEVIE